MINDRGWPGRRMDRATRASPHKPMALRFSDPRGVDVLVIDYGKMASFPFYDRMYESGDREP